MDSIDQRDTDTLRAHNSSERREDVMNTNESPATPNIWSWQRYALGKRTTETGAAPDAAHRRLDIFIGKWINQGHTMASADVPSVEILTSDVYEWMPGGFFVLHTAYGRIGTMGVGGTEILSYDAESGSYRAHFFDSQGNVSVHRLAVQGDTWIWTGTTTRCRAIFTNDGMTQTAHHERLDEHGQWVPAMEVTLTKVL